VLVGGACRNLLLSFRGAIQVLAITVPAVLCRRATATFRKSESRLFRIEIERPPVQKLKG